MRVTSKTCLPIRCCCDKYLMLMRFISIESLYLWFYAPTIQSMIILGGVNISRIPLIPLLQSQAQVALLIPTLWP